MQEIPVRIYESSALIVLVAPMPGLEPGDISATIEGDRVVIHGEERGPRQHERDLLLAEWTIGPFRREVTLPQPVDASLTNATYGNGVLVLSMPKAAAGKKTPRQVIRLQVIEATRGERVGHTGHDVRPTTDTEHQRGLRRAG